MRPTRKRAAAKPHSSKPAKKVTEWEAKQQHKAIEKLIAKAQREAGKKTRDLQNMEPACSCPFTSQQLAMPGLQDELQTVAWSPDGAVEQISDLPGNSELFFGSLPEPRPPVPAWEQPVRQRISSAEAIFMLTAAGLRSEERLDPQIPANTGALISEVKQGIVSDKGLQLGCNREQHWWFLITPGPKFAIGGPIFQG